MRNAPNVRSEAASGVFQRRNCTLLEVRVSVDSCVHGVQQHARVVVRCCPSHSPGCPREDQSENFQIYYAFCTNCHYYESWGLGFRFLRSAPAKTSKSDSWYWCKNLISGILRDTALRPSLGQPVGCSTRSRAREQESACALQHEMLAIERSVLAELERVRGRNSTE